MATEAGGASLGAGDVIYSLTKWWKTKRNVFGEAFCPLLCGDVREEEEEGRVIGRGGEEGGEGGRFRLFFSVCVYITLFTSFSLYLSISLLHPPHPILTSLPLFPPYTRKIQYNSLPATQNVGFRVCAFLGRKVYLTAHIHRNITEWDRRRSCFQQFLRLLSPKTTKPSRKKKKKYKIELNQSLKVRAMEYFSSYKLYILKYYIYKLT